MSRTAFTARSLTQVRADLLHIYAAAIGAVAPNRVVARALRGELPEHRDLPDLIAAAARIRILAVGKAAAGMAVEAHRLLGAKVSGGLVIVPAPLTNALPLPFAVMTGRHPLPDESSEAAGGAALAFVVSAGADDLLLLLLSGGASALMAAPAPGITLAEKIGVTSALMRAGASIRELNAVRKHLSVLKGGGLLRRLRPEARMLSLILSDVPGNDLATIGSGPAVADPTTFADAIAILKRRKLWGRTPEAVRDRLENGAAGTIAETMKAGDPALTRSVNVIVGDNETALAAAEETARALGYTVERGPDLSGEAEPVGLRMAEYFSAIACDRVCVIAGGEPVVTVKGQGMGGRAQHCALAMALALADSGSGRRVDALFAGTDGIDGPTDAAGAIISSITLRRAHEAGLDPQTALKRCDSYPFFKALGDSIVIGPTGTNVADLFVGVVNFLLAD